MAHFEQVPRVGEGGLDVLHIPTDAEGNPIPLNKQTVNGQDIPLPDPAAEGRPHTVLGGKVSSKYLIPSLELKYLKNNPYIFLFL